MASAQPRVANADVATIVIACACGIFAANLTLLVAFVNVDLLTKLLLKPMWTGLFLAYRFTGGSDGTPAAQEAAPYVAAMINALVYFAAIVVVRLIWMRLMLNPSQPAKRTDPEEIA